MSKKRTAEYCGHDGNTSVRFESAYERDRERGSEKDGERYTFAFLGYNSARACHGRIATEEETYISVQRYIDCTLHTPCDTRGRSGDARNNIYLKNDSVFDELAKSIRSAIRISTVEIAERNFAAAIKGFSAAM